jgi:transporter family-2 protein
VLLAALGGLALAIQAAINGRLGAGLGDGELAALVSFGSGLVVLLAVVPTSTRGRAGLRRLGGALRGGGLRWWQCLGGTCGAFLVTTQGMTVAELGVAVFTVAVVAGQVLSSLVVDRVGIGPAGPQPLTPRRTLGALLAVPAVAIAVADEFGHSGLLVLAVLPVVAGLAAAWQQAVNGLVRAEAGDAFVATLVNFAVGSAVLAVVVAVRLSLGGWPGHWPTQWWQYLGGTIGIVVILTAVGAVRLVGVLVVGLCSVAGQLVGALVLDVVFPGGTAGSVLFPAVGTAIALVAVVVAAAPPKRAGTALGGWRRSADSRPRRDRDPSRDHDG